MPEAPNKGPFPSKSPVIRVSADMAALVVLIFVIRVALVHAACRDALLVERCSTAIRDLRSSRSRRRRRMIRRLCTPGAPADRPRRLPAVTLYLLSSERCRLTTRFKEEAMGGFSRRIRFGGSAVRRPGGIAGLGADPGTGAGRHFDGRRRKRLRGLRSGQGGRLFQLDGHRRVACLRDADAARRQGQSHSRAGALDDRQRGRLGMGRQAAPGREIP